MARNVTRIRPDLWNAILDYRSGHKYVWVGDRAEAAQEGGTLQQADVLPTITPSEFIGWKRAFADRHKVADDPTLATRLNDWAERNLPTASLPGRLQGPWNGELKSRIAERLKAWFAGRSDSVAPLAEPAAPPAPPARKGAHEELRAALISSINEMTYRELLEIRLPAVALIKRSK